MAAVAERKTNCMVVSPEESISIWGLNPPGKTFSIFGKSVNDDTVEKVIQAYKIFINASKGQVPKDVQANFNKFKETCDKLKVDVRIS